MRFAQTRGIALACLCLAICRSPTFAQGISPDAAVGTEAQRLSSAIEFSSTGTLIPEVGLAAAVRLGWTGTAGFMARSVYRDMKPDKVLDMTQSEAGRSGFYNFRASNLQIHRVPSEDLPTAVEYDVRQSMSFGVGGRTWPFYVPMPRVFRRIAPTPAVPTPPRADDPSLPEPLRAVLAARPPPGVLPVGDVGRFTARAVYEAPAGSWVSAPANRDIDSDFAAFRSRYAVNGRVLTVERTVTIKAFTVAPDREADLEAFFQAVEADRMQTFSVRAVAPDARTEADRLNDEGAAAIDKGLMTEAVSLLQRAVQADPDHRWAWFNLGSAHLARRDAAAAVQALERAAAVKGAESSVHVNLGQAYELAGRMADAQRALTTAVERSPEFGWALQTLAGFLARRGQFAASAVYGERLTTLAPRLDGAFLSLGHTYLELGRVDDAVQAFTRGVLPSSNGVTSNNAAWALAQRGVALDVAWDLARSAIDKLLVSATQASAQAPRVSPLELTQTLANFWNTAGWVKFKQGHAAEAVTWLDAAWRLTLRPHLAEYLGDALASLGRTDEAATAYAWASSPDATKELESKFLKLAGAKADEVRRQASAALTAQRTLEMPPVPGVSARGAVAVTYDRAGRVLEAAAARADEIPAAVLDAVRAMTMPVTAPPDGRRYQLVRDATVTCAAGTCSLVFAIQAPAPSSAPAEGVPD